MGLQPATGAHPDKALGPQHGELFKDDSGTWGSHASCLHADRFSFKGACKAQHSAFFINQTGAWIKEIFGDVLGSARVARAQNGWRVVTWFGS